MSLIELLKFLIKAKRLIIKCVLDSNYMVKKSETKYYQEWIEEFECMSRYMRHYNKDFWQIEVYINDVKEKDISSDELSKC